MKKFDKVHQPSDVKNGDSKLKNSLKNLSLASIITATAATGANAGAVNQGASAKNTYTATDAVTFTATTATTVLGNDDAAVNMVTSDGTNTAYALSGGNKLTLTGATFSLKALSDDTLTINMSTSGTGLILAEATDAEGTITINGAAGTTVDVTAADTHTFTFDGSAAFAGGLEVSHNTTFSGAIGSTNGLATINVDTGKTGTFSETVKATTITLTGDGVFKKAVTGTTIALVAGKATFQNTTAVATDAAITETSGTTELAVLNSADTEAPSVATFNGAITVDTITIGATNTGGSAKMTSTSAGSVALHGGNHANEDSVFETSSTHTGAIAVAAAGDGEATLKLSGATPEVIGAVTSASDGQGVVVIAGTSSSTFDAVGTDGDKMKSVTVNASSFGTFGAAVAANTLTITGTATLQAVDNESEVFAMGASSVLYVDKTITNGLKVINEVATTRPTMTDGAKIYMPENLSSAQTLIMFDGEGNAGLSDNATTATELNAALQDNALFDYVATSNTDNNGTTIITASAKSAGTTASELNITKNEAIALAQAHLSAIDDTNADSDLEDAMGNALNSINGVSDGKTLAKQVAPQQDLIVGSTQASKAVTGAVQGVISNRMASLRSGDAYVAGMSAGDGVSANSMFLQAYGSIVEQDDKLVGSGHQAGYDSDTSGVAFGIDGISDGGMVFGVSLSMANTDLEGKGAGKVVNDIDTYTASIYMDKASDAGYVEGSVTFGISENASSRVINSSGLDRTLKGEFDSQQVSVKIGGGLPYEANNGAYVTPFASVTGTLIENDAYTETSSTSADNLRLRVNQDDINSVLGTVGIKAHYDTGNGVPMLSLAVNNEFGDTDIVASNTYQGGGSAFKTTTAIEEMSATLGLGYAFTNGNTDISVAYEAQANNDDYLGHYGNIRVTSKF